MPVPSLCTGFEKTVGLPPNPHAHPSHVPGMPANPPSSLQVAKQHYVGKPEGVESFPPYYRLPRR
jgi:hypothetical protein